jgi:ankyrin repeat protein
VEQHKLRWLLVGAGLLIALTLRRASRARRKAEVRTLLDDGLSAVFGTDYTEENKRVARVLRDWLRRRIGARRLRAAVAVRKAEAPPEVRAVLDGGLGPFNEERKRGARIVAEWLVGAHAAAHGDLATKRLARLVLGVRTFTVNMEWAGVFDAPYKAGLRRVLQEMGAPLGETFAREGLCTALGGLTLPPHELVAADQKRCTAEGRKHVLRSDIDGIVPLPAAWALGSSASTMSADPAVRQHHERVFTHVLVMMGMALNKQFHEMMRKVLGPHVMAGEGVMAKGKGGGWRLTLEKGVARMECKRVTDHCGAPGCRPGLNIDVLRIIGVCETPEQLKAALAALGARFRGCGRVKNGFAIGDAAYMFNLRTMMANFVVDFGCSFSELVARAGVAEMWAEHVERSTPQGGAPRGVWRAEASAALAVLTGTEFAGKPVRFVCEAQLLLADVFQVRTRMHEPYKGYRADSALQLHADMLGEAQNVARELQFAEDGDTALKAACRDGDVVVATRLLDGGVPPAERDAAFVVACARGRGTLLAALSALRASAGRAWDAAWERAADEEAAEEVGADIVEALLPGASEVSGGVDFLAGAAGETALLRAARGGHVLAVDRLLVAGAAPDLAQSDGTTPLIMAAMKGHAAVVDRLLRAGAAVDLVKSDGAAPLFVAAMSGHVAVVDQLLVAGAAVDLPRKSYGDTPLIVAAQVGREATVARLLRAGAVPDLVDSKGCTPLWMAAMYGHEVVVAQLLDAGAAVDLATNETQDDETHAGATPLMKAAQGGHVGVARLLLAAGADADRMSVTQGSSPRTCAAATASRRRSVNWDDW